MLHTIKTSQFLERTIDEVWDFMSDPHNLKKITPPYMGFHVLSETEQIYPGQIIEYYVRPLLGIKLHWVTEITHVKEGAYFVDEQRFGPYAFWHHKHFIKPVSGGVEMIDIVHYKVPMGILGRLLNRLFIKKQLEGIFKYRQEQLDILFSSTQQLQETNNA